MRADGAVDDGDIAGPDPGGAKLGARRDHADAGRGDEQPVGLAAVDDLGIAGDDANAGPPCSACMVAATRCRRAMLS